MNPENLETRDRNESDLGVIVFEIENLLPTQKFDKKIFPRNEKPIGEMMKLSNGLRESILPEGGLNISSADQIDEITLDLYNLWRDAQFSLGFQKILENKKIIPRESFFIGDIGSAHCISVGLAMMNNNIPCNFVFKKDIGPRVKDMMLLIGDELNNRNKITVPAGAATLTDCHRNEPYKPREKKYSIQPSDFPAPEELKNKGITQIVLLKEVETGREFHNFEYPSDDNSVLNPYKLSGMEIITIGIDEVWRYNSVHGGEKDRELFGRDINSQRSLKEALKSIITVGDRKKLCDLLSGRNIEKINP
ncbi:MAG: hypothetical protein A3D44_03575 [Candidatus Staskawiczbacteria bacterium RIFCSPHIGHO2_02_FULL_42_22]|uniref:Uncharacterized protein n=1 Tax=Candidatus Staskawiczbacteria bacterium RIFCSPHIGHO2_02_FULL_42_22 TaxID=1802207 RepID=A0A1G2I409_9BACT|nr:MAG: hypothetical protein A3D44_03575 [Candidatus Staskawiczbacteria bacterium RIFCSPHIGHO2_02_FULL_42_22]